MVPQFYDEEKKQPKLKFDGDKKQLTMYFVNLEYNDACTTGKCSQK